MATSKKGDVKRQIEEPTDNLKKLFEAVKTGQSENIDKYLELKADINGKDENGSTPLHIATQLRKFVIQKQLLFKGASVQKKDDTCAQTLISGYVTTQTVIRPQKGRTPMHYAAGHGDVETMKLLLAYGASIKIQDKEGCTPLHFAVGEDHEKAMDLLVFCGANAKVKDSSGRTSKSMCKSEGCKKLLKESKRIVYGIDTGEVKIEPKELRTQKAYGFTTLGLVAELTTDLGSNSLSFLCRRTKPEYCGLKSLGPTDRELRISDIFDYRLSGTQFNAPMKIQIPIYNNPPKYEEICIKTNKKPQVDDSTVLEDIHCEHNTWTCKADIDITTISAFTLVTRPKVEKFPVSSEAGTFTSQVDNYVAVSVEKETFDKKGTLSLNMMPSIPYKETDHPDIPSTGMYYDINYSHGQPKKDVDVTIPLPFDYQSNGDLLVMSRKNEPQPGQAPGEAWEVVAKNPETRRGRTTFKAPHFSVFVAMEVLRAGEHMSRIRDEAEEIFVRSVKKERTVIFMTMIKPMRMADQFWFITVLEIVSPLKKQTRQNDWFKEGYSEVRGATSNEFETYTDCFYKIGLEGNVVPKMQYERILQYHHHRDNYFVMHLKVRDPDMEPKAFLDVNASDTPEEEKIEYKHMTKILVHLNDTSSRLKDIGFRGFTRDSLLKKLADDIDEEEQWVNISLYLGVHTEGDFATTDPQQKFEALVKWRDRCKHRNNLGVPMLVMALRRSGREDLVEFIREELQKWLREPGVEDKFYLWLKRKLEGVEATLEDENPEPMSDEFFLTLASRFGEELYQLSSTLDISAVELDDIKNDIFCTTEEQRLLEFLCVARDKQSSKTDAFGVLLDAFTNANMDDAYSWSFEVAEKWVEENVKNDDEYAILLEEFLEDLKWNTKRS